MFLLFLSAYPEAHAELHPSSAVTYHLSGGRLGDNLVAFLHAAWLAHLLDIPVAYAPFPYGDQFKLSTDPSVVSVQNTPHSNTVELYNPSRYIHFWKLCLSSQVEKPALFKLTYYPESLYELEHPNRYLAYPQVNWDDPAFVLYIRQLLAPIQPMPKPKLPKEHTCVALHMRTGKGHDSEQLQELWPVKAPPTSYFIEAIQTIYSLTEKPLYIFIFTDHPEPITLQREYEQAFPHKDITFACRSKGNHHKKNVLEDFFSMGCFDCLIRPDSNYSLVASKVFPYQVVISPLRSKTNRKSEKIISEFVLQIGSVGLPNPPVRTVIRSVHN